MCACRAKRSATASSKARTTKEKSASRLSPPSLAITAAPGPPGVSQKTRRLAPRRLASAAAAEKSGGRSEERRVGKECRSRWSAYQYKKKGDFVSEVFDSFWAA